MSTTHYDTIWRPVAMLAIIALILIAFGALAIVGFATHILFSPWLLLLGVGILLWIKFGPRRSRQ